VARAATVSMTVLGAGIPPAWKRVASSIVLVPAFVWVAAGAPKWVFQALVIVVSAVACRELVRMLDRAGRPIHARLAVVVCAVLTASTVTGPSGVEGLGGGLAGWMPAPDLVLTVGAALILSAPLARGGRPDVARTAYTLLAVVYVGWLLGYTIRLHWLADGAARVLFLAGVTWSGESAAYLLGSAIGRHQLAPVVSPRKTVEGSIAQLVVSVAAGFLLGAWLLPWCPGTVSAAAGALLGVVGQLGDLAESAIKRSAGTKDTGALIPGHGGMLDRIDSLLFNAPAFYFYSLHTGCLR